MREWIIPTQTTQHFTFVLFDQFSNHVFSNALEPLRAANTFLGRKAYTWSIVSTDGTPVQSSAGMTVLLDGAFGANAKGDALILLPSYGYRTLATPRLSQTLRAASGRFAALIGIDGGAWLLAAAGLLDQRRATIHFDTIDEFAEAFPNVETRRERWVDDGDRLTASGAGAAFELMMTLIAATHGTALTLRIASLFAAPNPATPGPLEPQGGDRRVRRALAEMDANIEAPLAMVELARRAGCPQRDLENRFARAFGATPRKVYQRVRLNAAHALVSDSQLSISEISARTGYENAAAFSRAFRQAFGQSPRQLRAT